MLKGKKIEIERLNTKREKSEELRGKVGRCVIPFHSTSNLGFQFCSLSACMYIM